MKVEPKEQPYVPITLTLETAEEALIMYRILVEGKPSGAFSSIDSNTAITHMRAAFKQAYDA